MNSKMVEIRDRHTFIPALAVQLEPGGERDRALLARSGLGRTAAEQRRYILLHPLTQLLGSACSATTDPYAWGDRTMQHAHLWLLDHFDTLESGVVVDVEFILGETDHPKSSEV